MRVLALLAATVLVPLSAAAGLVVSYDGPPAGAISTALDGGSGANCSEAARSTADAGFQVSANGAACIGYSGQFDFSDNGIWTGIPLIADASGATTITIDLHGYFSYAGGFINYGISFDPETLTVTANGNDPIVTALDANMEIVDSYDIFEYHLGQWNDVNDGLYLGISSLDKSISYLQISGSGIAISDISVVAPEPGTGLLGALALVSLGLFVRSRRASL